MSFFGSRRQAEPPPPPTPQRSETPQQPSVPPVQQPVGFDTVLGANCTLEGTLRSNSNVRLDGTFTGTLEITGNVLVGETAKINADINAKNISIAGAVRGNVNGKKVQLLRTGRIWGDIHAQALTTEEGAFIDGKITMMSQEHAPTPHEDNTTELRPEDKLIAALTPEGMGATEEDPDDMYHEGEGDSPADAQVDNISEGEYLPVGSDAPEGQANADLNADHPDDDHSRQST
jgi:cytoskeletal protein CcmA (bactofilin family)